jgi:transcriptional regulator with XRE-family HTH domain
MTIAERLQRLLAAKGLSAAAVAENAGMERQQVWRIVKGLTPNPGVATLRRIVEAADATLGEFFADEDE